MRMIERKTKVPTIRRTRLGYFKTNPLPTIRKKTKTTGVYPRLLIKEIPTELLMSLPTWRKHGEIRYVTKTGAIYPIYEYFKIKLVYDFI